jgi:hypothetical protein
MAMDKDALAASIVTSAKAAMYALWGSDDTTESDFEPLAQILADEYVKPIIQHIIDNAETDPGGEGIL